MKEKNTASSGEKKKHIAFMFTQFNLSRGGRGRVGGEAPLPFQTWNLFETKVLTSTGPYITF